MKKYLLTSLFVLLVCGLALGNIVPPAAAAEKGKYGGILRVNHFRQAGVLGEPLEIRAWNHEFVDFVLQSLTRRTERYGEYDPELALSWEVNPDKLQIIFKLRKGVKFHDGTVFNAQAVKWNLDRWIASSKPQFSTMKSVEVIDDFTIQTNFSALDAVTLYDFARFTFIISPTAFEKNSKEWVKANPVGTGAFKLVKSKRNTYLKYDKFDDYWEKGLPYLDGLYYTMTPDPMTASASLRKGEIDVMVGVDPVTGADFRKSGGFDVMTNPGTHLIIYFNSEDPNSVWSDVRMRKALDHSIDRENIAKVVMRGFSFPVYEILHSINISGPAAGLNVGTVPRKFNPEKARQLIKEAGHSKGLKVKVTYHSTRPSHKDTFLVLQSILGDLGIEAIPNPLTGAALNQKIAAGMPPNEIIIDHLRGGAVLSLPSTKEAFHRKSVWFKGVKKPERFVDLLDKAMNTDDTDEQFKTLIEMERMAYGSAMFTPIVGNYFIAIQNPKVKDAVWFYAGNPIPSLRRAWLSEK